jgi:microcystin-dependent protein
MSEPFLGEIRAFSFQFAPRGWQQCNGQLLSISQFNALFALLGTTYGGNGTSTFGLPDLRGRIALSAGNSSFGAPFVLGQVSGEESHTLLTTEIPAHTHTVTAAANGTANATNVPGNTVVPGSGSSTGAGTPAVSIYAPGPTNTTMLPLLPAGNNQGHENRMPLLVMNYCIAMAGIFPSRN